MYEAILEKYQQELNIKEQNDDAVNLTNGIVE